MSKMGGGPVPSTATFRMMHDIPFTWDAQTESVAYEVALRRKSFVKIAEEHGICDLTIRNWRSHPDFIKRVEEIQAEILGEIRKVGVGSATGRVLVLNDLVQRLQQTILERSEDPSMVDVPGGKLGVVVLTDVKGTGESARNIYKADVALVAQVKELLQAVAQHEGQWMEKVEHSGGVAITGLDEALSRAYGPEDPNGSPA